MKRELVKRIVDSAPFNKSERLSSFLLHICELEIQGRGAELSEKEIGHSVFGLPTDYDPSIDGIVRSHASRLRRKLETYYLEDGREDEFRLVIPRGGYLPHFEVMEPRLHVGRPASDGLLNREGSVEEATGEIDQKDVFEFSQKMEKSSWAKLLRVGLAVMLAVAVMATAGAYWRMHGLGPGQASPFRALFAEGQPTILVPGDSGIVVWQEIQHRNLALDEYLSPAFIKSQSSNSPEQVVALSLLGRRYTSMVDLEIVDKLSKIARDYNAEPILRYSRDVRPNDLKHNNVVLIGSSETNPWNLMFQGAMNFVLNKDQQRSLYSIENRHPLAGEPARWLSDPSDHLQTAYCKVSYLANPSGEGNILVLEGTSMAGTECAWEFIANQDRVGRFLRMAGWKGARAPHFEVLLRTNNLAGNSAASLMVAWRINDSEL